MSLTDKAPRQRVDWDAERERYIAGTESLRDVADRLGTTLSTVSRHACGTNAEQKWNRLRASYRASRDHSVREQSTESQAENLKQVNSSRVVAARIAVDQLIERLDRHELSAMELVAVAKLGIDTRIHIDASRDNDLQVALEPATPERRRAFSRAVGAFLGHDDEGRPQALEQG